VVHVANIARASHSIIVVPPPPSAATPEVIGFPVVGEVSDRLAVHRRLRRQLVEVAQSSPSGSRISILDPTDALSDETGLLRAELTFDGCHTNAHGRAIVRTEVERVLLARASQGPRGAMASSDRG
jgi:lysophospholipase L1-like esterase